MTLREARVAFTKCLAELVSWAFTQGYEAAFDEVTERLTEKDPTSDHMPGSLHHSGLAGDILLYRDGRYLTETADYLPLGERWEAMGVQRGLPLTWGGRFKDGNHFSLAFGGKK